MHEDELEFVGIYDNPHWQVSEIWHDGKLAGIERVSYPKSQANPFVPPVYQYVKHDNSEYATIEEFVASFNCPT